MKTSTKILIAVCVIGLSLLLYPTVSNYWNEKHSTKAINTYIASMEHIDKELYRETWEAAVEYNTRLAAEGGNSFVLPESLRDLYAKAINISENGVMGYIEISKIGVTLPVYHGTSESVLQVAVGHIDWSSLPVGGESTHCVLSGHRGLPTAKLFTDLDKLREGDTFTLVILGESLTYEVDQIRTVVPSDLSELGITEGRDYCTLVTCTPYGINTHRLLVRGHRVEGDESGLSKAVAEAVKVEPLFVAPVLAFPALFIGFLVIMLKKPKKKLTADDLLKYYHEKNESQHSAK